MSAPPARWLDGAGTGRLMVMRRTRGRGWMIDLFLWVCPLTGVGGLIIAVLAERTAPPWLSYRGTQFFGLPSAATFALAIGAVVVPLMIACATRRAIGFLAGASLILFVLFAAGWVRSHLAADGIAFHSFEELADGPWESQWSLVSHGGGAALLRYRWQLQQSSRRVRQGWQSIGWARCLEFQAGASAPEYPLNRGIGAATQPWTRRLGFALGTPTPPRASSLPPSVIIPLAAPYWFLCLLTMFLPLAWMLRYRRRRRVARRALSGQCVRCGYDLRAAPDAGGARLAVCPECGASASAKGDYCIAGR